MSESRASRRLVKSPPELWSEVSNAASLQRHLDQFGDIRITKLEPETGVAWEGEYARGTISLEPSGWGTRVTLTAQSPHAGSDDAAAGQADAATTQQVAQDQVRGGSDLEVDRRTDQSLPPPLAKDPMLPYSGVETEMHEFTAFLERSRREAEMRKRRWPRRLAHTFRRWFGTQSGEDTDVVRGEDPPESRALSPSPTSFAPQAKMTPVGPEPAPLEVEPEPVDGASAVYERGPTRYEATPTRYDLDPAGSASVIPDPATSASGEQSQQAPSREAEPTSFPAQSAALHAALDSLGRAHHRPYSRA